MEVAAAAGQNLEELRPEPRAGVGVGGAGGHFSPRLLWWRHGCWDWAAWACTWSGPLLLNQVPAPLPPRAGHVREVSDGAREEAAARTPLGGQRECGGERGRYDGPPREHPRRCARATVGSSNGTDKVQGAHTARRRVACGARAVPYSENS